MLIVDFSKVWIVLQMHEWKKTQINVMLFLYVFVIPTLEIKIPSWQGKI